MTAVLFLLRARQTHDVIGQGLICPDARYASVRWFGAERFDRRFSDVATWRAIAGELQLSLSPAPLPRSSPIVKVLLGERADDVDVQYLVQEPIAEGVSPTAIAGELDARLRLTMV